MDILLFPVKLGGWLIAWACGVSGCGYQPEHAVTAAEPLCVRAAPAKIPDLAAVEAALDGARAELADRGALASSYPCLLVEVLRVDEFGTGASAPSPGATQPFARGTSVAVSARGWVEAQPGAPPQRDTGDLRRAARAGAVNGAADFTRHADELRAAADRVGHAVAARVLGLPEASDELP